MRMAACSFWLSVCLAAAGFAASGYLLYRSFVVMAQSRPETGDVCSAVFGAGCDATLLDRSSWVMGIPLAGWGIVYYVALGALLALAAALRGAFAPQALLAALVVALAGLSNSVMLTASMTLGMSPLCPLCMFVHVINLLLVPSLYLSAGRGAGEMLGDAAAAMRYVLGRQVEQPTEAAWRVVGFVTAALAAIVAYQWVYLQVVARQAPPAADERPGDALADFLVQPTLAIPVSAEDPRLGPADADAVLVVFSDFQCPHCARVAEELTRLSEQYAGRLAVVYKHFPLSNVCHPRLKANLHPRACQLAWGAEAAHRQGKFWAFHDAAFAAGDSRFDDAAIEQLAHGVGLDMPQFTADRQSETIKNKVLHDIELGREIGVRGTPAGYLQGRGVATLSYDSLVILLEHHLNPRER